MTDARPDDTLPPRPRWLAALPVVAFIAMAGLFAYSLQVGDPARLPSALLGKPVPDVKLAGVDGLRTASGVAVPGFGVEDFAGKGVTIVNVWASWCVPCTREHPQLVALAEMNGVTLFGINYKDKDAAARRFLGRFGNPFTRVGKDGDGRASVEWGLTGVPETFVVDGAGRIAFKYVGELTSVSMERILLPEITRLLSASTTAGD